MKQQNYRAPMSLKRRFTFRHTLVTALAVALAEVLVTLLWPDMRPGWRVVVAVLVAAGLGTLLGVLATRELSQRLERILDITRAWLRGNLALRIDDAEDDELSLLSDQLDVLAEHLEEDEEDLDRLGESNTRLTDQVRALAVVEERNRLARELHDSVKQHLFSLAMTASAIRTRADLLGNTSGDLREMAQDIETAAQNAQRETTRLIEDLRPGNLAQRGLSDALNEYTLIFGAREHLLVYVDVQQCDDRRLRPDHAEALYRVTQEALHNVARHAKASRVDVQLSCTRDQLTLVVEDNGIGFDAQTVSRGMGVSNMQERLLAVGGKLTIESEAGIGTRVLAEVAVDEEAFEEVSNPEGSLHPLSVKDWAWLGRKLVVPVGQTWPWLPVEEARYLRQPLIRPNGLPISVRRERNWFGLRRVYSLRAGEARKPMARLVRDKMGFDWNSLDDDWELRNVRGRSGRSILLRDNQPIAAMQYRGRQMHTWTEIVYDGDAYRLSYVRGTADTLVLTDDMGVELLRLDNHATLVMLSDAVPLPLLLMVTARGIDEAAAIASTRRNPPAKATEEDELPGP